MKKILIILIAAFVIVGLMKYYNRDTSEEYLLKSAAEEVNVKNFDKNAEDYKSFTEKIELFSAKLTVEVYQKSDKNSNIAISPISVYMALAMAVGSSNGDTKEEMLNAVGVTEEEVLKYYTEQDIREQILIERLVEYLTDNNEFTIKIVPETQTNQGS